MAGMDSLSRVIGLIQGIVVLCISPLGLLGMANNIQSGDTVAAIGFGLLGLGGIALGIWQTRRQLSRLREEKP